MRVHPGRTRRRLPTHQARCVAAVAVATLLSFISAPYPEELRLQHIPTAVYLIAFSLLVRRFAISNFAATCLTIFMLMHVLGARYLYSNVPYDRWMAYVFGWSVSATFDFTRNHYDRLCHFAFGLLWYMPAWEVFVRYFRTGRGRASLMAVLLVMTCSAFYEIIEWGLTMVLAPAEAASFNGQQGDIWDAQKDMFAALSGALVALVTMYPFVRRRYERAGD